MRENCWEKEVKWGLLTELEVMKSLMGFREVNFMEIYNDRENLVCEDNWRKIERIFLDFDLFSRIL